MFGMLPLGWESDVSRSGTRVPVTTIQFRQGCDQYSAVQPKFSIDASGDSDLNSLDPGDDIGVKYLRHSVCFGNQIGDCFALMGAVFRVVGCGGRK